MSQELCRIDTRWPSLLISDAQLKFIARYRTDICLSREGESYSEG
jgi:hypothetical protein